MCLSSLTRAENVPMFLCSYVFIETYAFNGIT